jgi:hypothetical protein
MSGKRIPDIGELVVERDKPPEGMPKVYGQVVDVDTEAITVLWSNWSPPRRIPLDRIGNKATDLVKLA